MSFWDVVLSIFWFMILFTWIWLLIAILGDIFRDHELSGRGKAGWTLFLVVVPWLGALVYLVARGRSMNERAAARARQTEEAFGRYVRDAAATGGTSTADEIAKLVALRDRGTLSAEEFQQAKSAVLRTGHGSAAAAPGRADAHAVPAATPVS